MSVFGNYIFLYSRERYYIIREKVEKLGIGPQFLFICFIQSSHL